ncbi:MAG: hypothetical protein KIS74_02205 [Burkholderiales bacterium]|nr:hypothetical protein [Burkholderiales bacterium]
MDMSFKEKSLWVQLLGLLGVYAWYFATVLPAAAPSVMPQHVVLFAVAVGYLVAVQGAGHIVIAVFDPRDDTDERDRLIALKGAYAGSWVLAAGVFTALYAAIGTEGNFLFTHLLLASWVLSCLVEIAAQLYLYRHGT